VVEELAGGDEGAERLIAAQEAERSRIARELHDDSGQWLASVVVQLTNLLDETTEPGVRERLGQLLFSASAAIEGVRRITRGLRPRPLEEDLATALDACAGDFSATHGIAVEIEARGLAEGERLPPAIETTVYRVVQEALTNVARHSGAKAVSLVVERVPGALRILVEDDGQGFDAESSQAGLGLRGLRERLDLVAGSLEIESAPGRTTLYATIPLRGSAHGGMKGGG
jgi:signal transduction histidine kinase